jgi:hypothetical protein
VVICPGAFLGANDYAALLAALEAQQPATGAPQLWVSVAAVEWPRLAQIYATGTPDEASIRECGDSAISAAISAAADAGFPLLGKPNARVENVYILMHSASAVFYPGFPMKHAAGIILLGADLLPASDFSPDPFAVPRSLMHVGGSLDGQARLPKLAWAAAGVAGLAQQLGPRCVLCYFVSLPCRRPCAYYIVRKILPEGLT